MKREDIFKILVPAFKDALLYVSHCVEKKKYIPGTFRYLKMEYFDSGLPCFSEVDWNESPKNYSEVFDKEFEKELPKSWQEFHSVIVNDNYLTKYLQIREEDKDENKILRHPLFFDFIRDMEIYGIIKHIVNKYIYDHNILEFDLEKLSAVYIQWESAVFNPVLYFDLIIPILCAKFNFDSLEINDNLFIEKIDDKIQIARMYDLDFHTVTPNKTVVGAATHGLVLKNWQIKNETHNARANPLYEFNAFSKAIPYIENFFAALRLVTSIDTGYAQIVILPIDWFDYTKGNLPQIFKVTTRSYPDILENFGWLRGDKILTKEDLSEAKELYNIINATNDRKVQLALKRLNSAFMRQSEEDTILDITIGLETLLVSDSTTELTHKLATRLSALTYINNYKDYSPFEVFKIVRKVYKYRSSIIHGSINKNKNKEIEVTKKEKIPTIQIALELFRFTLNTLLNNTQYLSQEKLDELLLNSK